MADNFENELKKQGDAYKVQPREWVWPRVEAELDKKKERRIAAWWWMAPLFLLLLGGGYFIIGNKATNNDSTAALTTPKLVDEKIEGNPANIQSTEKEEKPSPVELTEETVTASKSSAKEIVATTSSKTKSTVKDNEPTIKKETATNTATFSAKKTLRITSTSSALQGKVENTNQKDFAQLNSKNESEKEVTKKAIAEKEITTSETEKESILSNGEQVSTTQDFTATSSENPTKEIILKNNTSDSSFIKSEENGIAKKQTDSAGIKKETTTEIGAPSIATNPKKQFKREVVWTINAGVGSTNNKNGLGLSNFFSLEQKMYADAPQYNSGTGNGSCQSCNASPLPLVSSKPGITLNLSVARNQWINSRWLWQAELGWQYQQMHQRYGGRKDSTIFYSNLNAFAYSYYYQSGSSSIATGYNHRLFLSNQIVFAMLKNRGLRLSLGLYGGWNISNNYLIPDKTNYRFVEGKSLYNKGFIGGEMGIKYVLKSNWAIGLTGKVDFSRSFTPPDGNNQYWKSWQLQAGIPVSSIKHLFKK